MSAPQPVDQGRVAQSAPAPVPGAPVAIPIEPRSGQIVFGLVLAAVGIWMLVDWIPSHRPMTSAESLAYLADGARRFQDRTGHWMFNAKIYNFVYAFAGMLAIAGIEQVIAGSTYRAYKDVVCSTCKVRVLAKKAGGSLRCPNGEHVAQGSSALAWVLLGVIVLTAIIAVEAK
jgi:hypothetical protein